MITGFSVRVPATVANVGPGFDTLAFALDWHNEIHIEPASQLQVDVEGAGAGDIRLDGENLVVRAIATMLDATPRARVRIVNRFPYGRGFGSSAAAIVGGLVAGRALAARDDSDEEILDLAVRMEGHADNVSACLLGGITVSLDGAPTGRLDPPSGFVVLVAVGSAPLATREARRALPESVPFGDAVVTAARAARLTAALAQGDASGLLAATDDVLHQPSRFALAPQAGELVATLRRAGHAAFLSGAGPSVAAIVPERSLADAERVASSAAPGEWAVRAVGFAARGAEIIVGA